MKPNTVKILSILILLFSLSATAQISTPAGYLHGTYHKGDTGTKSEYDADKAKHESHADTIVIKRVPTAGSEARIKEVARSRARNGEAPKDTTTEASATTPDHSSTNTVVPEAVTTTSNTSNTTTDCNCVSPGLMYSAMGLFGLASLIGLIVIALLLRSKKEKDGPKNYG